MLSSTSGGVILYMKFDQAVNGMSRLGLPPKILVDHAGNYEINCIVHGED